MANQHWSRRVLPPLGAALTLGLVLLDGCNRNGAAGGAPPAAAFAPAVTTVSVETADVPIYLDEIGKAVASQSVMVLPQVSGPIVARHFEDGADLKKGQSLFDIDPRPFQAQLDQAQGQLAKDTATMTSADWNVTQDQQAMQTKAISEQQLHNDIGSRDAAKGAIAVDNAMIEQAKLNLEYCHVTSPINGRAGARLVDVGNVVNSAGVAPGTDLLSIQTLDPIYADFTITEGELLKVQQYMRDEPGKLRVQVELPEDATIAAGPQQARQPTAPPGAENAPETQHPAAVGVPLPKQVAMGDGKAGPTTGQTTGPTAGPMAVSMTGPATQPTTQSMAQLVVPREGKLDFLDNAVQDGSGTVRMRATLPNSDHHFWPGQFVNVRLVLAVQKNAVLIPSSAAQISQTGPYVYVVGADSTASLVPIKLGQRQGSMVVVESGLKPGDQVVTAGFVMIRDKAPVTVHNAPAGPPGGRASASASTSSHGGSL